MPSRAACAAASASSGSSAIMASARRISAAWPVAASARRDSSSVTDASAAIARFASTSGSMAAGCVVGNLGGGATLYAGAPAPPGLTPMPFSSGMLAVASLGDRPAAFRIEVAGEQVGQLVEGGVGAVAVGFEDHLGAALGTERQHREHAARRHGPLLAGADGDFHRLLRRGGDEQRGGTGVQ